MKSYIFEGKFGLERETLRIDKNSRLAQTLHPFDDENLSRDFCENQLEIITPVCNSVTEVMTVLEILDSKARTILDKNNETLWLYSNPPHIKSEADIPIAQYGGILSAKHDYRINLARRYGKRMMLYSGIHFNFSFSDKYLESFDEDKNTLYFHLLKQVSRYSWFLVLLTAASPIYDLSFDEDGANGMTLSRFSSLRNSHRGYWNQFIPQLDYTDLSAYVRSIRNYIEKGILFSAGELYLPVRLKPRGENSLEALQNNGVDHIELRMFDLNPLEKLGIAQKDLEFAHLFLIYLLNKEDFDFTPELQKNAITNHQKSALYDISDVMIDEIPIKKAASDILDKMEKFFVDTPETLDIITYQRNKLNRQRICEKIKERTELYV
ncbi:MAG: glutathione synthase [Oscillospiraceae bacterium]|nr:glutathione synthase [Ruminococcus sp.]MDE5884045.1 glutathione synthase [Oscillospiraceae bacterium]